MKNIDVTTTLVNGKLIEMIRNETKSYTIYNNFNDRTIVGNEDVYLYLLQNKTIYSEDPLYDFIEKKKKFNILDVNILNIRIKSSYVNKVSSFSKFTTNNYVVLSSLLLIFLFIFTSSPTVVDMNKHNIFFVMIVLWVIQLITTIFHELSHFYYYQRYFNNEYTRFGITIRYISLFLFFTAVPFLHVLDKSSKRKLILAGIKTQITLLGITIVLISIFPILQDVFFIKAFMLLNLLTIVMNIIPFFRLDGYWYISTLLETDSYMEYYKKMLLKQKPFKILIFLIGTLNFILILTLILSTVIYVIGKL